LQQFNLELHPDKTHLIAFGRFAASNRKQWGQGKPETFDFLGFTHICGTTQAGKFAVFRHTQAKKRTAKLKSLYSELRARMNWKIPVVGRWLRQVLQGHYQYYGVPFNYAGLKTMRHAVVRLWQRVLSRRSHKGKVSWERMQRIADKWLPKPEICHPYPNQRLCV